MKKIYEELETSDELKAKGLRHIKRNFRPKKGEMTLKDCQVITTVKIDADIYKFLESKSENSSESSVEKLLNTILRERLEKEEAKKLTEIKEIRSRLLNDNDFLQELKEKLAVWDGKMCLTVSGVINSSRQPLEILKRYFELELNLVLI